MNSLCSIVSFGAPVSNEYRLIVEGQAPISIHTSQVSVENHTPSVIILHGVVLYKFYPVWCGLCSQVAEIAKLMKAYIQAVVAQY